jgi:hypothetical protein
MLRESVKNQILMPAKEILLSPDILPSQSLGFVGIAARRMAAITLRMIAPQPK